MVFSFHITSIYEGKDFDMYYQNHLESVYCMSGEGEVESRETGEKHQIKLGVVYVLEQHDGIR